MENVEELRRQTIESYRKAVGGSLDYLADENLSLEEVMAEIHRIGEATVTFWGMLQMELSSRAQDN